MSNFNPYIGPSYLFNPVEGDEIDVDQDDELIEGEKFSLSLGEIKHLFDLCVGSMDFGSGFLNDEDVELLRKVAVCIGIDPVKGTPKEFLAGKYAHEFEQYLTTRQLALSLEERAGIKCYSYSMCRHCFKEKDHFTHNTAMES